MAATRPLVWPKPGRLVLFALLALLTLFGWLRLTSYLVRETGYFYWVGTDFALYSAQARAYDQGPPIKIYRQKAMTRNYRAIARGHSEIRLREMRGTHLPYPPIFAASFVPLARMPPLAGFAVWTALNLLAAAALVWMAVRGLPPGQRPWLGLLLAGSYPVAYPIVLGQVQLFLACALGAVLLLLRARREVLAGLCLSLLLLKPHYALLLAVVLVWKRRWRAVAGAAAGVGALLVLSFLASDWPTMLSYRYAVQSLSGFRAGHFTHMIGFRASVLALQPEIAEATGLAITLALSAIAAGAVLLAWRGPWAVSDWRFPALFSATLMASLLAAYHSHAYGPAILVVPVAAYLADARPHWLTRAVLLGLFLVPTVAVLVIDLADVERASRWLSLFLALSLIALLAEIWRSRGAPATARS